MNNPNNIPATTELFSSKSTSSPYIELTKLFVALKKRDSSMGFIVYAKPRHESNEKVAIACINARLLFVFIIWLPPPRMLIEHYPDSNA